MRTKYGSYKEYHTSLDNLIRVVRPQGLSTSYKLIQNVLLAIEKNFLPKSLILCEPMLSKRNLYPSINVKSKISKKVKLLTDVISLCDGKTDLISIAEICKIPVWEIYEIISLLISKKIIK